MSLGIDPGGLMLSSEERFCQFTEAQKQELP